MPPRILCYRCHDSYYLGSTHICQTGETMPDTQEINYNPPEPRPDSKPVVMLKQRLQTLRQSEVLLVAQLDQQQQKLTPIQVEIAEIDEALTKLRN